MSTTRPARWSSTPTPRSRARSVTCSPPLPRAARPTGWSPRSPDGGSRCAYGGAWAGQLRWGRLTHARVLGVLKSPCYAGAYVHGRYTSRRSVDPAGTVRTALIQRPRAEWPVLINDHHEGYLSWADYLANEAKL